MDTTLLNEASQQNKRRPQRTWPSNERQITFADINTQHHAQVALKLQHITFRVSGLSLYVTDSQEYVALAALGKAGIKPVNG